VVLARFADPGVGPKFWSIPMRVILAAWPSAKKPR
jgi:hypothetical protein